MMSEINGGIDKPHKTRPYVGQATLEQHVLKLVYSRQSLVRVSVANDENINVRHRMLKLQIAKHDFDFSYFYSSKLARQTDWLTAISGKDAAIPKGHQNRHSPGSQDWHNVIMKLSKARHKTFVIVLDNATENVRFLKMKRNLNDALWRHRKYLKPKIKYLLVKRKESKLIL